MPHDRNGTLLNVDDVVLVECRIKTILMQDDYCNVTLETTSPMPPYTTPTSLSINARQVVKKPVVRDTTPEDAAGGRF